MKILFITQFFPPEMGAAASRISGLARNLYRLGHEVTVLTGFPNYPSGVIDEGFREKLQRGRKPFNSYHSERGDGITINRVWVFVSPLRNFFTRLCNYLSLVIVSILFEALNNRRYDVAVASSPPLFLGISGYVIARLKHARFVFDVRDIWPKIGVDTGELRKDSIFIKLAERLEAFLYEKADMITVVTGAKADCLKQKGVSPSKVKVIPNGVDREFLEVEIDPEIKARYFNDRAFVVIYAGLLGIAQGVEIIIEAANLLKDKQDIKFYIIGDGVERGSLIRLTDCLGLKNVAFIESQPKKKVATFVRNADVSVIPLKAASLADSVPSKLLESMALGCPVVLAASGEAAMIVDRSEGGLIVEPGDHRGLATAIMRLYNNPDMRLKFSRNGTRFIEENFMRDNIARRFQSVAKGCRYETGCARL